MRSNTGGEKYGTLYITVGRILFSISGANWVAAIVRGLRFIGLRGVRGAGGEGAVAGARTDSRRTESSLQVGIDVGVAAGGVAGRLVGAGEDLLRGAEAVLDLGPAAAERRRRVVALGAEDVAVGKRVIVHEQRKRCAVGGQLAGRGRRAAGDDGRAPPQAGVGGRQPYRFAFVGAAPIVGPVLVQRVVPAQVAGHRARLRPQRHRRSRRRRLRGLRRPAGRVHLAPERHVPRPQAGQPRIATVAHGAVHVGVRHVPVDVRDGRDDAHVVRRTLHSVRAPSHDFAVGVPGQAARFHVPL